MSAREQFTQDSFDHVRYSICETTILIHATQHVREPYSVIKRVSWPSVSIDCLVTSDPLRPVSYSGLSTALQTSSQSPIKFPQSFVHTTSLSAYSHPRHLNAIRSPIKPILLFQVVACNLPSLFTRRGRGIGAHKRLHD